MSRAKWKLGEDIALKHYLKLWYRFIKRNYTIRGGEIDIILENETQLVFLEVKVVDGIMDISNYISAHKLKFLHRTIATYLYKYPSHKKLRLDVVFVRHNQVFKIYKNITAK